MSAILTQLPNILLAIDSLDSLAARFQKVAAGMKAAVSEGRDLNADELAGFRADAEAEDVKLADAIARAKERENANATAALTTKPA